MKLPTHAISLHQPWATGLVHVIDRETGERWKQAEFRTWALPKARVGVPLAIHAAKKPIDPSYRWEDELGIRAFPLGSVVGIATFGSPIAFNAFDGQYIFRDHNEDDESINWITGEPGCPYDMEDMGLRDCDQGAWAYAWRCPKAVELTPIPCRGHQGIWPLPEDVIRVMRVQFMQRPDLPQIEWVPEIAQYEFAFADGLPQVGAA